MKSYGLMIALLAMCFLASPETSRAQSVYAYSDIVYYEPTDSVLAYAEGFSDYPAELYYCLQVMGPVYKNGVEQAWIYGDNYTPGTAQCGGWATADTWLPHDPDAEYEVVASHQLETRYRTFDESGFEDYYNFSVYGLQDPLVYSPGWFGFSGGGPPYSTNVANIFLGTVYTAFSNGAAAGPPHHLKVVDDQFRQEACGQVERRITYRVVDSLGRGAGATHVKEIFPGTITDSCSGQNVAPSPCNLATGPGSSNFTDQIRTGCPTQGGACGFTINPNRWAWCTSSGSTWLATLNYNARWSFVAIDSNPLDWPPGTQFYP